MSKRLAPHLRVLDNREEKIDRMLIHFDDARAPLGARPLGEGGSLSRESRRLRMPVTWTACYQELDRVLSRMYDLAETPGLPSPDFRSSHVHLRLWYFHPERRRVPVLRVGKRGRKHQAVVNGQPQFEVVVTRKGDPGFVMKGLEWVSREFQGGVFVPSDFENLVKEAA